MKLQFKRQAYQAASVESIVDCFSGQKTGQASLIKITAQLATKIRLLR